MDVRLLKLLDNREEKYPHALEAQYRRILNNIIRMWDTPDIQPYFSDLLVSSRSNRKGFPPEVAVEIAYLSMVNTRHSHTYDPWAGVPKSVKLQGESQGELYAPPAFFKACEKGQRDVLVMYFSVGVAVNARDERLWTPLMICACYGHEKLAALLLDKDAKVNARSLKGFTPLLQAAGRGNLDTIALLLEYGADLNAVAEDGSTALHKATANNHPATVAFLLDKGADTEATLTTGEKPLDIALKAKKPQLIALLQGR